MNIIFKDFLTVETYGITDRLRLIMKNNKLSQSQFAHRIGIHQPSMSAILQGKRPCGDIIVAKIITAFPNISREWLMTGEGEMITDADDMVQADVVPLLPMSAYAGSFSELIEQGATEADCEKIVSPVKGCDLAISISGDSMEPDYPSGCLVFIRRINPDLFIPWGNVFVLDTDNGAYIKKVFPGSDQSTIVAKSINPKYPDFIIPIQCVRGIYMVIMMAIAYAAR